MIFDGGNDRNFSWIDEGKGDRKRFYIAPRMDVGLLMDGVIVGLLIAVDVTVVGDVGLLRREDV